MNIWLLAAGALILVAFGQRIARYALPAVVVGVACLFCLMALLRSH